MPRREEYRETARLIAAYLAERQRPDGTFPGPDHYGVASALWLWSRFGVDFARQMDRAWTRLKSHLPSTHGEFNVYALLHCQETLGPDHVAPVLRKLRLNGRSSANWMLLRAVCRTQEGPYHSPCLSHFGARAALALHRRCGLIEDRPGVRSLSYHAFCGALLADLYQLTGSKWAARAVAEAAAFIVPFALPNGDALYLGRGQQQIFGYGALLYLLETAAELTGESEYANAADRVFGRLCRRWRPDGSFPLVLREGAEQEPWRPDASRPGWYSYNCYADYLPFLGCMLLKAAGTKATPCVKASSVPTHPAIRMIHKPRYTAVLSAPRGPATNDLCFPYICVDEVSLFPCYGREGAVPGDELPLPYTVRGDGSRVSFRDSLRYWFTDDGLEGANRSVRHTRRFEFGDDGITCTDDITFARATSFATLVPANFLFRTLRQLAPGEYETWHRHAKAKITVSDATLSASGGLRSTSECHIIPDAATTASGRLVALRREVTPFAAQRGERVTFRLRIDFP